MLLCLVLPALLVLRQPAAGRARCGAAFTLLAAGALLAATGALSVVMEHQQLISPGPRGPVAAAAAGGGTTPP